MLKPECLVSLLFCEVMLGHECILLQGIEQFSRYKGYGFTFTFDGDFVDHLEVYVVRMTGARDRPGKRAISVDHGSHFLLFEVIPCLCVYAWGGVGMKARGLRRRTLWRLTR